MSVVLLLARLALALVFAVAAVAKLADRSSFARTLGSFGVPNRLAPAGSIAIPLAELAVAALLFPAGTARWGAFAALVLLAVFCVAIARVLVRGDEVDCGCFGEVAATRVTRRTLARNAGLGAVAGAVVVAGPGTALGVPSSVPAVSPTEVALGALAFAVAVSWWLGWQLFRQNARLLARIAALESPSEDVAEQAHIPSGPPAGTVAPAFDLPDAQGRRHTLDDLLEPGVPLALVFSDPDCGACAGLAETVAEARASLAGSLEIALITRATSDPAPDLAARENVLFEHEREVGTAYGVRTVPHATIVDPLGRMSGTTATGRPAVDELLASHVELETIGLETAVA